MSNWRFSMLKRIYLLSIIISISFSLINVSLAANPTLELKQGLNNLIEVTRIVHDKFEKEVDLAHLYKHAWQGLEKELPAEMDIPAASHSIYATTSEIRDFYADRITDVLTTTTRMQPDDATPTITTLCNTTITSLVNSLNDPYSQYLPAPDHKELQRALSGEPDKTKQFYGVGIHVDWDNLNDEGVLVVAPLPDTPAFKSGIREEDVIVAVNGEFFKEWEGETADKLEKAIEKIKGEEGTEVTLTIKRPGTPELLDFTMKRAPINPEQLIFKEMLDDEIGYIRLYSFYASAAEDVLESLRYLKMEGMKRLIFDLRLDPGGYLDQAVKVAGLFLKNDDLVTYTTGRASPERRFLNRYSTNEGFEEIPMVVLINEWSASASEVVTGALKDNDRAQVIGKKSFGKGSVQEVFPLKYGDGLRLTVAHYYTPLGVNIHEKGIQPDIEVDRISEEEWEIIQNKDYNHVSRLDIMLERDPQLRVAFEFINGQDTSNYIGRRVSKD
jgi:carboxyl-terminal processing protease